MSRTVSQTFKSALFARETDEVFIVLIDLLYDATHFRVCSESTDVTSNGETFYSFPFEISLPDSSEKEISQGTLTIDNISQDIVAGIRAATSPPTVTIQIVLASDPDTVEVEFTDYILTNVTYDALLISGSLSIESFIGEPFPADSFTPGDFPGLF
jgi:hypothetical protein